MLYIGNTKYQVYSGKNRVSIKSPNRFIRLYDAEVEYLECTRQQWINTGISFNDEPFSFIMDFEPTARYDYNPIFCISSGTRNEGWIYNNGNYLFRMCTKTPSVTYTTLKRHKWGLDWTPNGFTASLDDTIKTVTYASPQSLETSAPLWLLHRVDYATGKLYGFKLWKEGTLVMDLIPVRVGQIGYMYDKISEQLFGNAGTGDFILGNDIEFYDYLQNDGVAYIDTEVIGSDDISTDLKFINLGASNKFVCGGTNVYTPVIVQSNNWFNTRYQPINSGVITTVLTQVDQNEHTIKFNFNHSITWDGIEYASNLSLQTDDRTILLFGSQIGTQYNATARIYYCKIYDNGVLIRDLVPCRYAGQNGMWDKVNNKFYGNANSTGTLTVGNDP